MSRQKRHRRADRLWRSLWSVAWHHQYLMCAPAKLLFQFNFCWITGGLSIYRSFQLDQRHSQQINLDWRTYFKEVFVDSVTGRCSRENSPVTTRGTLAWFPARLKPSCVEFQVLCFLPQYKGYEEELPILWMWECMVVCLYIPAVWWMYPPPAHCQLGEPPAAHVPALSECW